jgi:SAM-dependent methyltransferase
VRVRPVEQLFATSEVISEISPDDEMHRTDADYYFHFGEAALYCVGLAMLATRRTNFSSILDLPCGHGRVLRKLKAAFPNAKLTACDIDKDGVEFCARVFSAAPVHSKENPDEIELDDSFDLIWCGSLLTHLNGDRWPDFLSFFESRLTDRGLLLFTVHGRFAAELMRRRKHTYGLETDQQDAVLRGLERDGFGFVEYEQSLKDRLSIGTYGISMSAPGWVFDRLQARPHLRVVRYAERAWGGQDVVACIKQPLPGVGAERVPRAD